MRIGQADDLESRFAEAVEAREGLRESDKRETRIFRADALGRDGDPARSAADDGESRPGASPDGEIYYKPAEGRQKIYIFPDPAFIKEAANALLKVLEEPPEFATIFLLAENPAMLLPTIRSRCVTLTLAPLPLAEIEQLPGAQRRLERQPARAGGAAELRRAWAGPAASISTAILAARHDALLILKSAIGGAEHSELFRATEAYRAGAEGKEKTEELIAALYSLLRDMLSLMSNAPERVHNIDIASDLAALSRKVSFEWIAAAADRTGEVQSGMRRNLLRSLSLDALASSLEILA